MIPEIGHFALILAMLLALVAGIVPMLGARLAIEGWMRVAAPATCGQFGFVAIAFGCLAASFLDDDFSVIYVVGNSNSALPAIYGSPRSGAVTKARCCCGRCCSRSG